MITSILHVVREAFNGLRNNLSTVLGAIVTIYLSLLVIGLFLSATMVINQLLESVESQFAISVYVRDDASEEDIWAMQTYIRTLPYVGDVTFISKEEALERFREEYNPEIVEAMGDNPLPASIEVSLTDPSKVSEVAEQIMQSDLFLRIIDEPDNPNASVKYGQQIVDRLFSLTRIIRIVSIAIVALLGFVSLIFINNTIRLAVFARRTEISIMRLVGASNGFIRGPFLLEGTLQALLGAGLAIVTIHFGLQSIVDNVTLNIPWLMINFTTIPISLIYFSLLGAGLLLGLIGSGLAMRRYLRV
ncbi:MAG: permease-like cell division protein FtsX [Coriobacteriia bacterium]|nr:permease-like cell division protein FtsX [Coriobacteriia bacterium]